MTMPEFKQSVFTIVCNYRVISFKFWLWKFGITVKIVVHLIDSTSDTIRLHIFVKLGAGFNDHTRV
jgi:hypothetical protein